LDNGRLYRDVAPAYDLFFTKDREFAISVNALADPVPVKVVYTVIPQQPEDQFVAAFIEAFVRTDWAEPRAMVVWPAE
jgi:hypothetical protein